MVDREPADGVSRPFCAENGRPVTRRCCESTIWRRKWSTGNLSLLRVDHLALKVVDRVLADGVSRLSGAENDQLNAYVYGELNDTLNYAPFRLPNTNERHAILKHTLKKTNCEKNQNESGKKERIGPRSYPFLFS